MLCCYRFEDVLGSHHTIGDMESVGRFEIYLVLTGGSLVMTGFNRNAGLWESMDHLTTHRGGQVGGKIKISTSIMGEGSRCFLCQAQQETLKLGSGQELVAHRLWHIQCTRAHRTSV